MTAKSQAIYKIVSKIRSGETPEIRKDLWNTYSEGLFFIIKKIAAEHHGINPDALVVKMSNIGDGLRLPGFRGNIVLELLPDGTECYGHPGVESDLIITVELLEPGVRLATTDRVFPYWVLRIRNFTMQLDSDTFVPLTPPEEIEPRLNAAIELSSYGKKLMEPLFSLWKA